MVDSEGIVYSCRRYVSSFRLCKEKDSFLRGGSITKLAQTSRHAGKNGRHWFIYNRLSGETAMKNQYFRNITLSVISLLTLLMPMTISAQTQSGPPPVAAPLVREGDLAVMLGSGLGMSTGEDEVEAENHLADAGIVPRNGWIADYPVTPDIIGELQQAVGAAVDAGKVPFSRDEALRRLNDALNSSNLSITPYTPSGSAEPPPPSAENYPNPEVVNNYYYNEGPPVVTYYTPPPNFYYLYGWIPSPFWWSGF
jgi:hypothetical protein